MPQGGGGGGSLDPVVEEETDSSTSIAADEGGETEDNKAAADKQENATSPAARALGKIQLTITLPNLPDRQQMDPVPEMVTFEDFTYEGLREGDDGPTLLRSKNVKINGFPTNSHEVMAGTYALSSEVYNLPGYTVTVKGGSYHVADKIFDEHPFTVSPEAAYTDATDAQWFNAPITLTATDEVFSYMKVSGVGVWGPTATLTKEVSSSSDRELFGFSIDDVGTNCQVIYKDFNYRLDTSPPAMNPGNLYEKAITDTEATASALTADANGVGSGVKTVYFLCLPKDAPAPTAQAVLAAGNAGVKDSNGFFNYSFSGLRGNTNYMFYAVVEDNVGNQTDVVAGSSYFTTKPSPLQGEVVLDNMSPKYGDKITATPNIDIENPGKFYYKWYRSYSDGREDSMIPWAFKESYTTSLEDIGHKLYCTARIDNAVGELGSEKTAVVSKADQKPLAFGSYNTAVPYGTPNTHFLKASGGTGSGAVTHTSSDTSVATVDATSGVITPVGVGTFTVTATKAGDAYYNDAFITSSVITVTPKVLNVSGMAATNREYDGTNVVELTGGTLIGVMGSDDVSLASPASGTIDSKSVGTGKFIRSTNIPLKGAKADCYRVSTPSIQVDIKPKTVTVEGVTVQDKTYDGNTATSYKTLGTIKGAIAGDDATVRHGTCTFSDKNVGDNKAVIATGFAVTGADYRNYTVASQPTIPNASIKQAELTVSVEKVTIKKGQAMPSDLTVTVAGFAVGEDESISGFVKPTASLSGAVDTTDETTKAFAVTFAGGNATSNYSFSYKSNAPIDIQTVSVSDKDYSADKDLSKWTNETIVVTPANGYTGISVDETNWLSSLTIEDEGENNLTFYLKKADGTLTEGKTIQSKIDRTAPSGEISIGENKWNTFLNSITFGLFFKDTQTAEITIEDAASGADKTYFYLSENALTTAEVEALDSWTEGGSASVAPDWKGIVYAKLTDKAGNASYLSSDGLVLDAAAPLIAGATDGGVYCISKELIITDDYLDTVSIDGNAATVTDGKITVYDKASVQTVTATDKAQNTVSVTITVNAAHTPAADDGDCTTAILCSVCGFETTAAKKHVLSDWQSDDTNHWKKCTNAGCTHTEQSVAHTPNADDNDCTTAVLCSVCGYETTVVKTHALSGWQSDATNHWKKCTNTGCAYTEQSAAHTPDTDDNDCTTAVLCSVCGYETTAAKSHALSYWLKDATTHWKKCTNADCIYTEQSAEHTRDAEDGDCTTAILCSVCGYETTEANTHVLSAWQSDATNHWKKCTNDSCTYTEQSAAHTWNDGEIKIPPTIMQEGEKTYICAVCSQTKIEVIPKLPSHSAIVDDSTGISVEYEDSSAFDSDIVINITSKSQAEMSSFKDSVRKAAPGFTLGGLYDVKLLKDGIAIQPDGKIKVSIPLTDTMKAMTDLKVVYMDDNGNATIIPSEVKDGKIVFITDHFSNYGIIGKVKVTDSGNNNGNNNGNGNGKNNNGNSPQTGDSSSILLFVLMMGASGIAPFVLGKKRKIFKLLKK